MSDTRRVLVTITAEYEIQLTDPFFANAYPEASTAEEAVEFDRGSLRNNLASAEEVLEWADPDTIQIDLEPLPEKP